jgi:hypothetical protein
VRITAYVSQGDKALTPSQFLFGSLLRFGRLEVARLTQEEAAKAARLAYLLDFVEVKGTPGSADTATTPPIQRLHNHMLDDEPRFFFLHYWGKGPAMDLARGVRSALDAQAAQQTAP